MTLVARNIIGLQTDGRGNLLQLRMVHVSTLLWLSYIRASPDGDIPTKLLKSSSHVRHKRDIRDRTTAGRAGSGREEAILDPVNGVAMILSRFQIPTCSQRQPRKIRSYGRRTLYEEWTKMRRRYGGLNRILNAWESRVLEAECLG